MGARERGHVIVVPRLVPASTYPWVPGNVATSSWSRALVSSSDVATTRRTSNASRQSWSADRPSPLTSGLYKLAGDGPIIATLSVAHQSREFARACDIYDPHGINTWWNGMISELVVFDRALNGPELQRMHQYLGCRYGALGLP
jgi:hypothetical protein